MSLSSGRFRSRRGSEEQLARIAAAEALVHEAQERVRHAATDHEQAKRERQRVDRLVREGFVAPQIGEQSQVTEATSANELEADDGRRARPVQ